MVPVITFYVALITIILMIVAKHIEIKSGKKSIISRLGVGTDHIVQNAYNKVTFVFSHMNKNTSVNVLQWAAFHVLSFMRGIYISLREKAHRHPHSKKVIDMVTGKGEVKHTGGASFFLKKIAEETKK
jgi:phosphoglycerate dehydrogenase-like enzyme